MNDQYSTNKNIRFKTAVLRSDLCAFKDGYIDVKGTLDLGVTGNNAMTQKGFVFKQNAPFRSGISKNTFIDNAQDFDIVMLMYYMLEFSDKDLKE